MESLAIKDKSSQIVNTMAYCVAAHPENKDKMWNLYFSNDPELDTWELRKY